MIEQVDDRGAFFGRVVDCRLGESRTREDSAANIIEGMIHPFVVVGDQRISPAFVDGAAETLSNNL